MTVCLVGGEVFRIKWKGNSYVLFQSYGFYNTKKKKTYRKEQFHDISGEILTEFADEAKARGLKVHWSVVFRMIMTNESSILKEIEANSM